MVIVGCVWLAACHDDNHETKSTPIDDPAATFMEDLHRSFENSYRVTYDLEVKLEDGETHSCSVVWWKDGTDRQRFDMCPPLVFGDDFDSEPWRILMFGDRDQILVCSSRLSLDPAAEELDEGDGACHEDSSGIGDLAGNAVYYLQFPLEYPDELPSTFFDSIDELTFEEAKHETVNEIPANCYLISALDYEEERHSSRRCFAENGAPVYRSGDAFLEYTLSATDVGTISDSDFEPPHPYVDASVVD